MDFLPGFSALRNSGIGHDFKLKQATSFSADRGTLRGMHYQVGNSSETKIIRCLKGAIYDVLLTLD